MAFFAPWGTRTGCKSGSLVPAQVDSFAQKIFLYMRTGPTCC